jgi:hypothetical protein
VAKATAYDYYIEEGKPAERHRTTARCEGSLGKQHGSEMSAP